MIVVVHYSVSNYHEKCQPNKKKNSFSVRDIDKSLL